MNREARLRRVLIVVGHFTRNLAYHRAGWEDGHLIRSEEFWKQINGNCLDIAILEWCKLFADPKDPHCWRKIVSDTQTFSTGLFDLVSGEGFYDAYCEKVRNYRDKFVAHLDDELIAHLPGMDEAQDTARYYYEHVIEKELSSAYGPPQDWNEFYRGHFDAARTQYKRG